MKNYYYTRFVLVPIIFIVIFTACAKREAPSLPSASPTVLLSTATLIVPTVTEKTTHSTEMIAIVNSEPILRSEWQRQVTRAMTYLVQEESSQKEDEALLQQQVGEDILTEMIDEQLIRQAAEADGLSITNSQLDEVIEREIELLGGKIIFDEWLDSNLMTMEEYRVATSLQLLTSALRERVTSELAAKQAQVHLRHILLPTESEALAVLAELNEGANFGTLVEKYSIDPGTRKKGGDLGWLPRGILPIALDEIVWKLGPNEHSEVIESEFGFHIIEVIAQDPARPLSLDMLQILQQQAWERWLKTERLAATIETWLTP